MLVLLDSHPLHLANTIFANSKPKSQHYNLTLYSYATSFSNTSYLRGLHLILSKQFHVHLHTRRSHWIASDDCRIQLHTRLLPVDCVWLIMLFISSPLLCQCWVRISRVFSIHFMIPCSPEGRLGGIGFSFTKHCR